MKNKNYKIIKPILLDNSSFQPDPELLEVFIDKLLKRLKIDEFVGCQPMSEKTGKIFNLTYNTVGDDSSDQFIDTQSSEILPLANITLEIVSHAIETTFKKFKSVIDLDAMDASIKQYGEYMYNQYIHFMAVEVSYEIQCQMLDVMYQNSMCANYRVDICKDDPQEILSKLYYAANKVGRASKRGTANKIIMPKAVFEIVKNVLPNFDEYGSDECDIQYMGSSAIGDIYVSVHSTLILVHYKGNSNEVDSNLIYAPLSLNICDAISPFDFKSLLTSSSCYALKALSSNYTVNIQVR